MKATTSTETADGGQLVDTIGRPALTEAELARRAARPIRDPDPVRNAAYWDRIDRIVSEAPPLSADQRLTIAAAFSTVTTDSRRAA